ncbi:MAG TPA: hypothetical protein VK546_12525 [Gaiellales bacterium]|nr:hypothetical protein [Gaiellales bacterium]
MGNGDPLQAGPRQPWRDTGQLIPLLGGATRSTHRRRSRPAGVSAAGASEGRGQHRRQLEALIDLLRTALELETRCDFGDGAQAVGAGRAAFVAHFEGWQDALSDWEERVRRARVAPAALWAFIDDAARGMGLPEPPLALGPLVDRLSMLTAQRSREGHLGIPHPLFAQCLPSGHGGSAYTTIYLEGEGVARLSGDSAALAGALVAGIQRLFDDAQQVEAAHEVGRSADAVQEAKHDLLSRLNELAAADAIAFAPSCPVCRASRRPLVRSSA